MHLSLTCKFLIVSLYFASLASPLPPLPNEFTEIDQTPLSPLPDPTWERHTSQIILSMTAYTNPSSTLTDFIDFIKALYNEIYRRRHEADGDQGYQHFHFSNAGIELDLSEAPGAPMLLNLALTREIVQLLVNWAFEEARGSVLPSVEEMRVTMMKYRQVISVGWIGMSGNLTAMLEEGGE